MSEPQGEPGQPGKQGAQGAQGAEGHIGETGRRGARGAAGSPWRGRNVTLSFWAIVIIAAVVVSVQGYALRELDKRAGENRALIERLERGDQAQAADRRASKLRFREADYRLCRQIELLKAGFRQQAIENNRNLARNLRILEIANTAEIREIARKSLAATLRRYKARSCGGS
jgi:hypothetical protein